MKKALLLIAASAVALGMYADELDVSPKNYQFYNTSATTIDELGIIGDYSTADWNLPAWHWENYVAERYNEGYICWAGGNNVAGCQDQVDLVNFGGEIGKCLAISTPNSAVNDAIAAELGEYAFNVHIPTLNSGQNEWFWFFNGESGNWAIKDSDQYCRIRLQVNVYHPNPAIGTNVGGNMYVNDNENNVQPDKDNETADNALKSTETCKKIEGEDEYGDLTLVYAWDPTQWTTLEWYFQCADGSYGPKLKWNISANWGDSSTGFTIFVRKLELAIVDGTCPERAPHSRTIETLNFGEAGISAVTTDVDAAPVYYNLQGVQVQNPTTGLFIEKRGNTSKKVYLK